MSKSEITTIKLTKTTKQRVDKLRVHKRETYEDILQRLLGILNTLRVSPDRAKARLITIDRQHRKGQKKA